MFSWTALIHAQAWASPTWQQLRTDDGWSKVSASELDGIGLVEVHTKVIEGQDCFLGKASTEVGQEALLAVAADVDGVDGWSSASLPEAETLGKGRSYFDYYQYLEVPVFSDRFWFLRGYIEEDGSVMLFRWERLDRGGPYPDRHAEVLRRHPSAEEPPVNIGAWVFTSRGGGTDVSYYICAHPGGLVPPGLQAMGTRKTLPDNLRDLVVEGRRRSG